jgi:hypothetical protein
MDTWGKRMTEVADLTTALLALLLLYLCLREADDGGGGFDASRVRA